MVGSQPGSSNNHMAGSPTFSNKSRNLLGFIKCNFSKFITNHQALLLTTIWFNFNILSVKDAKVMACSTAGQGLQITKWPTVQLSPLNLEIYEFLSNEAPL